MRIAAALADALASVWPWCVLIGKGMGILKLNVHMSQCIQGQTCYRNIACLHLAIRSLMKSMVKSIILVG